MIIQPYSVNLNSSSLLDEFQIILTIQEIENIIHMFDIVSIKEFSSPWNNYSRQQLKDALAANISYRNLVFK